MACSLVFIYAAVSVATSWVAAIAYNEKDIANIAVCLFHVVHGGAQPEILCNAGVPSSCKQLKLKGANSNRYGAACVAIKAAPASKAKSKKASRK